MSAPKAPPAPADKPCRPTAVIKNYIAADASVPPQNVCSASIMPCVRKQGEADRMWFEVGPARLWVRAGGAVRVPVKRPWHVDTR